MTGGFPSSAAGEKGEQSNRSEASGSCGSRKRLRVAGVKQEMRRAAGSYSGQ